MRLVHVLLLYCVPPLVMSQGTLMLPSSVTTKVFKLPHGRLAFVPFLNKGASSKLTLLVLAHFLDSQKSHLE